MRGLDGIRTWATEVEGFDCAKIRRRLEIKDRDGSIYGGHSMK